MANTEDVESEVDDELDLPEPINTTIPIQEQIELAISEGLNSGNLAMKMKAATLAAKCGMIKAVDRNIKISPVSERIIDVLLMLMVEHGLKLEDLLSKMEIKCSKCTQISDKLKPKVML